MGVVKLIIFVVWVKDIVEMIT